MQLVPSLRLGSIVLGALLAACGGASPTPPSSPATSAAPAPSSTPSSPGAGVAEGGECGDDVAIQKKCAQGLVCAPKPGAPISEHTPGVCTKK